ncbi:MAG: hypothetical protein AUG51_17290 [Acidobacteria bacterium 13_1_20CM_3_53_8]|nr:MAG: hypothetical protein AUG51_17290 [Acidobacteria bacterium 13_1_20CM_3_53_8]
MSADVERVLNEIKALTPEEQQQVRAALEKMVAETTKPQITEEEFMQHLLAKGIISEIPSPTEADIEAFRDFKPIKVTGKPISETIIEERR